MRQTSGAKIKANSQISHSKFVKGKRTVGVFSENSIFLLPFLNEIVLSIPSVMPALYLTHLGTDIDTTNLCKEMPAQWRVVPLLQLRGQEQGLWSQDLHSKPGAELCCVSNGVVSTAAFQILMLSFTSCVTFGKVTFLCLSLLIFKMGITNN